MIAITKRRCPAMGAATPAPVHTAIYAAMQTGHFGSNTSKAPDPTQLLALRHDRDDRDDRQARALEPRPTAGCASQHLLWLRMSLMFASASVHDLGRAGPP
jgi:hypothetical protein